MKHPEYEVLERSCFFNIFHLHNSEEQRLVCGCVQYINIAASDYYYYYHHHYSGTCMDNNAQQPTVSGGHVIPDNIN
jgi:hypothetical protein